MGIDVAARRGAMDDEYTIPELMKLWGLGRTRTWERVVKDMVVPYRRDVRGRIYVKRVAANGYIHVVRRGRPPMEGKGNEG